MCYEGIQKLCFDCGRMGHKRENCLYSIRQDMPPKETVVMELEENSTRSCISHGANADKAGEGSSGIVPDNGQGNVEEHVHDITYGPWIVVKRKVNGAKNQRSSVGPQPYRNVEGVQWHRDGFTKGESVGLSREIKRKISPPKVRFGAQGECSVIELECLKDLKGLNFSSLSPKLTKNGKKGTRTEKAKLITKPSPQASVKGKKALARSRATTNPIDRSIGSLEFQAANNPLPFLFTAASNRAAPNGRSV